MNKLSVFEMFAVFELWCECMAGKMWKRCVWTKVDQVVEETPEEETGQDSVEMGDPRA